MESYKQRALKIPTGGILMRIQVTKIICIGT